jgi:hypothetical protein
MPELIPSRPGGSLIPRDRGLALRRRVESLERRTTLRTFEVHAEGIVSTEKVHELNHVAREAVSSQAFLAQYANTVAAGDPVLRDDLEFFVHLAKLGKGEVLADLTTTYCRESTR